MFEGEGGTGGNSGGGGTGGGGDGAGGGTGAASGNSGAGGTGVRGGDGSGGGTAGQGSGVDEDRIVDKLWDRTRQFFGGLLGEGKLEVDDGAGGTGDGQQGHQSGAQVEDDTERKVREILGKVKDEDEAKADRELLHRLAEASPVPQSRSYRAMFGSGSKR